MRPESRKVRRFGVQLPCTFGDRENRHEGTVLNLSLQGCAMITEKRPALSSYLSLQIDLLDGAAPIAIELAGVRWVCGVRCGLEFIRVTPEMIARLRSFVSLLEETP